jgi:hypothetical protein
MTLSILVSNNFLNNINTSILDQFSDYPEQLSYLLNDSNRSRSVVSNNISPVIITQPISQSVAVGVITRLSVTAIGFPLPNYQWYFNNNAISGATTSELNINNSSTVNNGIYYVVIWNAAGTIVSNNATLFVIYPNPPNAPNAPNSTNPYNNLYSHLYNQLYNQTYNQLYNQLYNQNYNQLYNQLYDALIYAYYQPGPPAIIPIPISKDNIPNSEIIDSNYDYIYNFMYNDLYDDLYSELYNQVYNPLYDNLFLKFSKLSYSDKSNLNISYQYVNVNNSIYADLYNDIFNEIIKQLYSQLFTQLFNDLYVQLNNQIYNKK